MAEIEVCAIRETAKRVVLQIVEKFHPLKVILLGSYAYGQPHEESDLDCWSLYPTHPHIETVGK